MPVLMIATYDEEGTPDVMNMAWGGISHTNKVALNINENHKTSKNIKVHGAFTIAIADVSHMKEADYFGIASGNKVANKVAAAGLTAIKSEHVDAPIILQNAAGVSCAFSQFK